MFLGQDRTAGGDPPDERQPQLLAQNVLELNAARSAGDEIDDALALQGAQVLLGGIRRLETQGARDFRARRRHPAFRDGVLDEPQNLGLTGSKVRHASPVYVDSDCYYIQSLGTGKYGRFRMHGISAKAPRPGSYRRRATSVMRSAGARHPSPIAGARGSGSYRQLPAATGSYRQLPSPASEHDPVRSTLRQKFVEQRSRLSSAASAITPSHRAALLYAIVRYASSRYGSVLHRPVIDRMQRRGNRRHGFCKRKRRRVV